MLLALHEFFITKPIPYVPSLLILDQPSQTQFPDDIDEEAEQEELLAVHKAFEAFDSAIERTNSALQVIVSEHAGLIVYEGIKNLTVVERWRRGRKLIPWHWDAEALKVMDGRRADWALEDLTETVLKPALASALGLSGPSRIDSVRVGRATFAQLSIEFEITVSALAEVDAQKREEDPDSASIATERILAGTITNDLSVSIVIPPTA
jgi:hypothetical protein